MPHPPRRRGPLRGAAALPICFRYFLIFETFLLDKSDLSCDECDAELSEARTVRPQGAINGYRDGGALAKKALGGDMPAVNEHP